MKVNVPFISLHRGDRSAARGAGGVRLRRHARGHRRAKPDDTDSRDALARSCARDGRACSGTHSLRPPARARRRTTWTGYSASRRRSSRFNVRARRCRSSKRRAQIAPAYEDVWRVNATALDSLDEFDARRCVTRRRRPRSSRNRPGRKSDARHSRSGACSNAARGFRSMRATKIFPAAGPPGAARRSASTGASTRIGDCFAGLHLEERFDTQDEQLLPRVRRPHERRLVLRRHRRRLAGRRGAAGMELSYSKLAARLPGAWSLGFRVRAMRVTRR